MYGKNPLKNFIFWSRWLQAPLYLGLIVAQGVYVYLFMVELWHLVEGAFSSGHISETETMLVVLSLIDVVMIANLLIMVIVGGYETFVSRLGLDSHPDQPEWFSHVNAGVLKIKLATAIVDPPAEDLHQRRQPAPARHPVAGGDPRGLPLLRPGHGHGRQDHEPDSATL